MHYCYFVGKPSLDPTHVDYVPTLFLKKKGHKRFVSMKQERVEPLLEQKITLAHNAEIQYYDLQVFQSDVKQLQAVNTAEMEVDDGGLVPEQENNMLLSELEACLFEREAKCRELERITIDSLKKHSDAEARIKDLEMKNVNLEADNAELKGNIEELHVQQQKSISEVQVWQKRLKTWSQGVL